MFSSPTLDIHYRPDLALLTIRWRNEESLPEQEADYYTILAEAEKYPTGRWLIDVRRRPHPTPELAAWAANVWLPQVVAALAPVRPRLGYLISPASAESLRRNADLQASVTVAADSTRGYDIGIFNDEGEATHWLLT